MSSFGDAEQPRAYASNSHHGLPARLKEESRERIRCTCRFISRAINSPPIAVRGEDAVLPCPPYSLPVSSNRPTFADQGNSNADAFPRIFLCLFCARQSASGRECVTEVGAGLIEIVRQARLAALSEGMRTEESVQRGLGACGRSAA